jgi:hypothetical protein
MHVFAYGSLLHEDSLRTTLPRVPQSQCIPALLPGHVRTFDVAFPNDGSQEDKAYLDDAGLRPPVVLFANIQPSGAHVVNGILIPLTGSELEALRARERRYEARDVTGLVRTAHPSDPGPTGIAAFVGRQEFTAAHSVAQGVVAQEYLDTITAGVHRWDARSPGFRAQFAASTLAPPADQIVALRRVDGPGPGLDSGRTPAPGTR